MLFSPLGFSAWDASEPAGTQNMSDTDTLVQANNEALEDALEDMRGWVNIYATDSGDTTIDVTADELWLQQSGDLPRNFSTVSETIDISASGASGLDTGTADGDGDKWYYVWIIAKDDNTINGLFSASSSSPTMPAGYVYKTLVSAVWYDDTADAIEDFDQYDDTYWYETWREGASGDTSYAWTTFDTTDYVPSALSNIAFGAIGTDESQSNGMAAVSNIDTGVNINAGTGQQFVKGGNVDGRIYWELNILTANTLYYGSGNTSVYGFLSVGGFRINKL